MKNAFIPAIDPDEVQPQHLANHRQPVPRRLLVKLWVALALVALFFVATFLIGVFRRDYDPWQQAVSALSLGAEGWIQNVCFIVVGVAIIAVVPVWNKIMTNGPGERAYPILIALLGLCFVAIAFVPQDPAPGYDPEGLGRTKPTATGLAHLALAFIASASSIACLFIMAIRFKGDMNWLGWRTYTIFMGVLTIV